VLFLLEDFMSQNPVRYTTESLGTLIFTIRGQRVILDADLAAHDESIREPYDQIRPLLLPPPDPPRKRIYPVKLRLAA
jgi:hypothetical protein